LKQRDGLASKPCNVALEYVISVKSDVFYKSLQLLGYVGNINIKGRRKRAFSEELKEKGKERGKEIGLNIRVEKKTEAMAQNRKTGEIREMLTINRS
jgi:hypothetical protein